MIAALASLFLESLALRGAVLLLLVCAASLALRRQPASLRHQVWALGAIGLLALPILSALLPAVDVPVFAPSSPVATATLPPTKWVLGEDSSASPVAPAALPASPEPARAPDEAGTAKPVANSPQVDTMQRGYAEAAEPASNVVPVASAGATVDIVSSRSSLLLGAWIAGVLLALLPYAIGVVRVRRIVERAVAAVPVAAQAELEFAREAFRLRKPLRLSSTSEVDSPATWGWRSPVILLPEAASAWGTERLRLVLLHEAAHVARQDLLVELAARLGVATQWMNPLAWVALAGIRRESERACDEAVLRAGATPTEYAACLVDVARGPGLLAATSMARGRGFEERVREILRTRPDGIARRRSLRERWILATSAAVALLAVAVANPTQRALAQDAPPSAKKYDVSADGSAPHKTVQAAIDAAQPGAVIRIGPGTFEGRIRIIKPVTLQGEGPLATTLTADVAMDKVETLRDVAAVEAAIHPTVRIDTEGEVVLTGLSLSGRSPSLPGAIRGDAIVLVLKADAHLTQCALRDSASSGLIAGTGASVSFENCLLAALGSEGVVAKPTARSLTLKDCDVRDCRHYCVSILGTKSVTIERCRISGSLWHGIRVDDANPTIRGNLISKNDRSGVYSSGASKCLIEDNLFFENGMSGVSCWTYANESIVRGNTFVKGEREGVALLGSARALVESNVFFENPSGVMGASIGGRESMPFTGTMRIRKNWFWKCEHVATRPSNKGGSEDVPWDALAADENVKADPGFANAKAGDFALPDGSPARLAGAGSASPLARPAWATFPEEKIWSSRLASERGPKLPARPAATSPEATAAAGTPPESRNPQPAPPRAVVAVTPLERARLLAKPWISGLHDVRDADLRAASEQSVRFALESDNPVLQHAAFLAISGSSEVAWDAASLHDLVVAALAKATGPAQVAGFYALFQTMARPEDRDRLLAALASPSADLIERGTHLLALYSKGDIDGPAAVATLRLLEREDPRELREALRGLWGARVDAAVEARLLVLAATKDTSLRRDVVYFALSTLRDKSPAVVAELTRVAESSDIEMAGRAAWGLASSVAAAAQPAAADVLLALFEHRSDPEIRNGALRGLMAYGSERHAVALEKIRDGGSVNEHAKAAVDDAIRRIRQRAPK